MTGDHRGWEKIWRNGRRIGVFGHAMPSGAIGGQTATCGAPQEEPLDATRFGGFDGGPAPRAPGYCKGGPVNRPRTGALCGTESRMRSGNRLVAPARMFLSSRRMPMRPGGISGRS